MTSSMIADDIDYILKTLRPLSNHRMKQCPADSKEGGASQEPSIVVNLACCTVNRVLLGCAYSSTKISDYSGHFVQILAWCGCRVCKA